MVCELGMSPLGPLMYRGSTGGWDSERPSVMSEEMARRVDEEVRAIVMRGYDRARAAAHGAPGRGCALAERLLAVESLDSAEISGC